MLEISWAKFKALLDDVDNNLSIIYVPWDEGHYDVYTSLGNLAIKCFLKKDSSDWTDFDTNYKAGANKDTSKAIEVVDQTPFAKPDYRTKRESNGAWITCPADSVTNIDYQLTEERYATGGEVIYKNAKEGDYVSACVYDKDSVIPVEYRAILCEAWPVVAEYINQKFLMPTETDKYGSLVCDTYPLSARITTGLYLRVDYHASSEVGDRKAVVNYNLNKKL